MAIVVDTGPAERAGISLRGPGGRSYFARPADGDQWLYKLWTDAPYSAAIAAFKTRAKETLRRRDIVIEVGPPGRA